MKDNQFPIGQYEPQPFAEALLNDLILDIEVLPMHIEQAIQNLNEAQLHTAYRPGGWTLHELVHHVADSHMNAYIRFKLGLTENNPTIKPYEQDEWVKLEDTKQLPINVSLTLLHAVHKRWTVILKNIKSEQWERTVVHPEHGKVMSLWYLLGSYAWHGKHHTAHINTLKENMNW